MSLQCFHGRKQRIRTDSWTWRKVIVWRLEPSSSFCQQIKHKMMNDGWRQVTRFFILQLPFDFRLTVSLTTKMKVKDGACIDSATSRTSLMQFDIKKRLRAAFYTVVLVCPFFLLSRELSVFPCSSQYLILAFASSFNRRARGDTQ